MYILALNLLQALGGCNSVHGVAGVGKSQSKLWDSKHSLKHHARPSHPPPIMKAIMHTGILACGRMCGRFWKETEHPTAGGFPFLAHGTVAAKPRGIPLCFHGNLR